MSLDKETVWLNRQHLATLFDRDIKTIGKHVNNVFKEGELNKEEVVAKFATTSPHGDIARKTQTKNIEHYNLNVIISVGYRVKSQRGTQFCQWATQRQRDYLVKGFAINKKEIEANKQQFLKTLVPFK